MAPDPTSRCVLEPETGVVFENGRMVATSVEPWLRFTSLASFEASRFVEIIYRSSLYDDPVRPILRFVTASGETDRILPGPIAGAGIWRGAAPKDLRSVLISPAARIGRFDFIVESIRPLRALEIAALVLARRPHKMFDIMLAAAFGYFTEAENAVAWAIGAEPLRRFGHWRKERERGVDPSGLDEPRADWSSGLAYFVVIDARDAAEESLACTLASLRAQVYENFRALIVGSEFFEAYQDPRVIHFDSDHREDKLLEGERFLLFLRAGDVLAPHAFALVTEELARFPEVKLFYSDELMGEGDETAPSLKPNWSPIFAAAYPYLGRNVFLSATEFPSGRVPLDAASFDRCALAIAMKLTRGEIIHLRRCLLTRKRANSETSSESAPILTVRMMRAPPSVSILLPTRDRADLLGPCLDSVLGLTTHPRFELVIIDNGTRQAKALSILDRASKDRRVRLLRRPGPFNFAAFNNEAAQQSSGEVLTFLNNDTVVLTPDWLEQLSQLALEERLGAVGCLLLYPNGLIQHAGVVLGLGQDAGHFEALQTEVAPSWLDRTRSVREASAVTAACLSVQRSKFFAVGRFRRGEFTY